MSTRLIVPMLMTIVISGFGQSRPDELAARVREAPTPEARIEAVRGILQALNVGVYTARGATVLSGGERGCTDFYLYDFELSWIARAISGESPRMWSLSELMGDLGTFHLKPARGALKPEAVRVALKQAAADALAEQNKSESTAMLIVRELMLSRGVDITGDVAAGQLRFDAIERYLLLLDATLPSIRSAPMPSVGATALLEPGTGLRRAADIGPDPCGAAGAGGNKNAWNAGRLRARMLPYISKEQQDQLPSLASSMTDALHAEALSFGLKITTVEAPGPMHYGHDNSQTVRFAVKVEGITTTDEPLVRAGWLAGALLPGEGPIEGVKMIWNTTGLEAHGTVDCPAEFCARTNAEGVASLFFTPKKEKNPDIGRVITHRGTLEATAEMTEVKTSFTTSSLGAGLAAAAVIDWTIERHNPNGVWAGEIRIVEYGLEIRPEGPSKNPKMSITGASVSTARHEQVFVIDELILGFGPLPGVGSVALQQGQVTARAEVTHDRRSLTIDGRECSPPNVWKGKMEWAMTGTKSRDEQLSISFKEDGSYTMEIPEIEVALQGAGAQYNYYKGGCNPFTDKDGPVDAVIVYTKVGGTFHKVSGKIDPENPTLLKSSATTDKGAVQDDPDDLVVPLLDRNIYGIPTQLTITWELRKIED